jgi:hypothetical protein
VLIRDARTLEELMPSALATNWNFISEKYFLVFIVILEERIESKRKNIIG